MPRLVKGGKYIYGWAKLGENYKIKVPPEALNEYGILKGEEVLIISGSKKSGGFGITTPSLLEGTPIGKNLLQNIKGSSSQHIENKSKSNRIKISTSSYIDEEGYVSVNQEFLKEYNLEKNEKLLVGRGSGLAMGFIAKGPIFQEAQQHLELEIFI